ncbi:lipase member H [Nilaparvata lugens]|uniref:lipase member H n=1 Tax=Nilaparvata lugens TaxID=108931 RepID=UPI00193E3326|nr:lipase member H [Nilaparvata lugens]
MKFTSWCASAHVLLAVVLLIVNTASAGILNSINLEGTQYRTGNDNADDVKFFLFYYGSENGTVQSTDITEDVSSISSDVPLTVILHGFMGSPHGMSTQMLIEAYIKRNTSTVVGVDWQQLAQGPWYSRAAEGAEEVANRLAHWLTSAVEANRTSWDHIHLVGFSLGAQVAGLTAKYLNDTRVGRITGLDPAKPLFDDKSSQNRLDMEDANFVSVVHSSGGFIAFSEPLGHVDFYPNGGVTPQLPCRDIVVKHEGTNNLKVAGNPAAAKAFSSLVCSHYVALSMWVISLDPSVQVTFTHCSSWPAYVDNKCNASHTGHDTIVMGEETPTSARGTYYMSTEHSDYRAMFAPQISTLIAEGLQEYSKLFSGGDPLDQDKGKAEIEEVKPTSTTPKDPLDTKVSSVDNDVSNGITYSAAGTLSTSLLKSVSFATVLSLVCRFLTS